MENKEHEMQMRFEELITQDTKEAVIFDVQKSYGTFHVVRYTDLEFVSFQALLKLLDIDLEAGKYMYVIGTSGKGSMVTHLHQSLYGGGTHVGSYVSPHIMSLRERYRVDDELVPVEVYLKCGEQVLSAITSLADKGLLVGYGTALFALGLLVFKDMHVDISIVEVGAGARYHFTNLIPAEIVVHTGISDDHLETLGPTKKDLAFHDAGALKAGRVMYSSLSDQELQHIVKEEAKEVGSDVEFIQYDELAVHALAKAKELWGCEYVDTELTPPPWFPGRFEVFHQEGQPFVIVDSAHNAEKMEYLAGRLRTFIENYNISSVSVIFALLSRKDVDEMIHPLLPLIDNWYATTVTDVKGKKFIPAMELADELKHHTYPPSVVSIGDPVKAFELAMRESGTNDLIVVTGSMYMIGKVREVVKDWMSIIA